MFLTLPPFRDGATEAQRGSEICSRSHRKRKPEFEADFLEVSFFYFTTE